MKFGVFFKPMLLTEAKEPFDSSEFLFELKLDGTRAVIHSGPKEFRIFNRRGKEITYLYPELREIQKLTPQNTILDGEIVLFAEGIPDFAKLQERSHLKDENKIKYFSIQHPVCFMAFDCLYKGKDLTNLTLLERKKVLEKIKDSNQLIKVKFVLEKGKKLYKQIQKRNLEGMVAKKITSTYHIATRSKDWIKIKNLKKEEFLIGGYFNKENHAMVTLYLGEYQKNDFHFVGKVMINKKSKLYEKVVKQKIAKENPFKDLLKIEGNYLKPKIPCTVFYMERTKNNHLRQAVVKEKI